MHHLTQQRLDAILASSEAAQLSADAKMRLNWIAVYTTAGISTSEVCARFGIARSTFHRWIKRFNPEDLSTLEEQTHAPHIARASNVDDVTANFIREYRQNEPLAGKEKIRAMLMADHGIDLSSSSIGRIIERDGLYFAATPLHWKKRTQYQKKNTSYENARYESRVTIEQTPVQTIIATPEVNHSELETSRPHDSSKSCACFWCSFWKSHGRMLRRTFGLASLAVNIAVIALYGATVFWEHNTNTQTTSADLLMHPTGTVSNLDAPPFNEQ